MLKLACLLLFLFVCSLEAKIQWNFDSSYYGSITFNTSIGTPGQSIGLVLSTDTFYAGLDVPDLNIKGGVFNPNASTTFKKTSDDLDFDGKVDGVDGTDTFVLGDGGVTVQNKPLKVLSRDWSIENYGVFGIGRPDDNSTSFIQAVLKEQEEQVIVFSFDQIGSDANELSSGTLTLGGRPEDCSSNWVIVPEVIYDIDSFEQWAVGIDKLKAGKYTIASPGQARLSLDYPMFSFPQTTYYSVLKGLGSVDMGSLPCNTTTDLIFVVGGVNLVISPTDYLTYDSKTNKCYFNGMDSFGSDNYVIPRTVFRNKCLLLDYENIRIGFADKLSK